MSYKKQYPALKPARRHLIALLRRTPGRRTRWYRQTQRRRPWLLRELTAGEKNLMQYKGLAECLAGLLEPFRRTRPKGHRQLQELLQDADTRPVVVAQVQELQACLDRIAPEYRRHGQQLDHWRAQWPRLSANARQRLQQEDKAICLSYYHDGIHLLVKEATTDVEFIKRLCSEAFEPVPEPWVDTATAKPGPTPYST
jgi:hypothetical protein